MKITEGMNYLLRLSTGKGNTSIWQVVCYSCLPRFCISEGEVISYSQMPCSSCKAIYKSPPGMRPPFKMRTVTYQIVASYPEYDLTA